MYQQQAVSNQVGVVLDWSKAKVFGRDVSRF